MRRVLFVTLAVALLVTSGLSAQTLGAVLTASQENPPTTTPGFGNATVTFDSTRQNITVTITVANLGSPITASHIHALPAGNVVLGFTPTASFTNNKLTGTFPITSDLATRLLQNPSNFYVNVHTSQFPGGAIRGQLALVSGTVVNLVADLRGSNETPANSSTAFGSVLLSFDTANNTITWELNTSGITGPSAAHIHALPAGNVVIGFVTSASSFTNGRAKGQITGVDATTMGNILANPSGFYFNVHSPAFPSGEIRGQLVAANEADIAVAGHVTNGIGQIFVSDARVFNPSYDTPAATLLEFFQAGTSPNTNATNSMVVNIAPRGTAILNDVAGSAGLNVTATGAVRVTSAEPVVTTSRIYTTTNGTFGQFVPSAARSSALRRGVMPQLSNSSAASGFRTNVGFFNPNPEPVTVRFELRDGSGNLVGQNSISLAALSQQQNSIGTYFPGVDVSNAQNLTLSFDASAPVAGYASVVDNTSADQIFVPAQSDSGVAITNQ
jgi:hypothetical protein